MTKQIEVGQSDARRALKMGVWDSLQLRNGAALLRFPDPDGGGAGDEWKLSPYGESQPDREALYLDRDEMDRLAGVPVRRW